MKNSYLKTLVLLLILISAMFLWVTPASAADIRSGDSTIVASGDVIDDDLYVAGSRIVINGTVNGDVLAAGETIIVDGTINGSIIAVGGTIEVNGEVTHSVRVIGANVIIAGVIGGDLAAAGGEIDVRDTADIGRDVIFGAGSMFIRAPVARDIRGAGGDIVIGNYVGGDVELGIDSFVISRMTDSDKENDIAVDTLLIEPGADIKGNFTYISKNEAQISETAVIEGQIFHKTPQVREPIIPDIGVWGRIIAFLMVLVLGIAIILIIPRRSLAVAASIKRRPLPSLGWGALILFATPFAILITFITVIGIPVGILGVVLYGIAIFISQLIVGLFIGYLIIGSFSKVESRGTLVASLTLGFAILTLVKLIPYLGPFIWLATVLFGIGAMAVSQKTIRDMNRAEIPDNA